jgi:CheY-like chemotaxis protein
MHRRVPIVLLIEPDAIQSVTLARALNDGGYRVIPARRADDALETFATHHMDIALVVADTQSATSVAPTLLDALRAIDPWVPVVAMSPATIDGRIDEYPNVVATLTKPIVPDNFMAYVRRLLPPAGSPDLHSQSHIRDTDFGSGEHLVTASTATALRKWVDDLGDASFCWPPTEAELDRIHVVDTQSGRPWLSDLRAPLAQAVSPLTGSPAVPGGAAATAELVISPQCVEPVQFTTPVQLAARQLGDPRIARRVEFRTHRWFAVAATALCGLSLTTLLELRGVSVKRTAGTAQTATASPALSARHHVDMMPLVPAERIRSRFDSRLRSASAFQLDHHQGPERSKPLARREPAPLAATRVPASTEAAAARVNRMLPTATTALGSAQQERISDVAEMAMQTAALPLPLVAARLPAPPPRIEVAVARIEPTAPRDAAASTNVRATAVDRSRDDERGIYQVIQQYERAYERLDVDAARAVWPSLNTRALARAFDGLKEQALEFSHCRVAMESREATAICGGRASYVPRVGSQATRTEPREWTFRLRKIDHAWLIAKAEVR